MNLSGLPALPRVVDLGAMNTPNLSRSAARAQDKVRKRVEALAQPMPEHAVANLDLETRSVLSASSAKALVTAVAAIGLIVALVAGCHVLTTEEPDPYAALPTAGAAGSTGSTGLTDSSSSAQSTGAAQSTESADPNDPADPTEASAAPTPAVVSIQGLVARPGLLRVTTRDRVGEVIDRAGGAAPEAALHAINLAEPVHDGMQIVLDAEGSHILRAGDTAPAPNQPNPPHSANQPNTSNQPNAQGTQANQPGGLININTADITVLESLPGVGPATATAIITWRETNGPFTAVEQLLEVRGIGPAKFESMRTQVTI
ncbi:MAG TPA: ComEA family DNA-binding protein [Candidatus Corynebacterium gallistercoris]|uniref:ComEA family DNA-binding protein n=1 Tax=Candidatus Corynebacterium gallistercoris TaxID=2838530 RepID=A0A9D1RY02_9CORY|nr:ComEA family DNA-binding protein [Candidatus Corynebacterium gallistercoris]